MRKRNEKTAREKRTERLKIKWRNATLARQSDQDIQDATV